MFTERLKTKRLGESASGEKISTAEGSEGDARFLAEEPETSGGRLLSPSGDRDAAMGAGGSAGKQGTAADFTKW